jgi:hypothetical protein
MDVLVSYEKVAEFARRLTLANLDIGNVSRKPLVDGRQKTFDLGSLALGHEVNPAIAQVLDKPAYLESLCNFPCCVPKADPLYTPGVMDLAPFVCAHVRSRRAKVRPKNALIDHQLIQPRPKVP